MPASAAGGPELARLAADLSQLLDGASLRALYVARAQQPATQSNQVKQVAPTR